jgi:hypothetical protein
MVVVSELLMTVVHAPVSATSRRRYLFHIECEFRMSSFAAIEAQLLCAALSHLVCISSGERRYREVSLRRHTIARGTGGQDAGERPPRLSWRAVR